MQIFPENSDISPSKRVKFGIDPTFPRLHLGHFIPLRFVKKLKEQGHKVTIVLGTFTAQLGDPSGRDTTRPILSEAEVLDNAESIKKQVVDLLGQVTFFSNHNLHNSISLPNFLRNVVSKFTLQNIISRDAFAKRIENNHPIAMHELLVPLLQGLDSVHLNAEIEVGGQDQLFNFQIARELQVANQQKPQVCCMFPLINGTDGRKMSKSFGNCIFLDEPSNDIFGKVMSISDEVMAEWWPLLTDIENKFEHPMLAKKTLACDIVTQLKGILEATIALEFFEKTIQDKELPDEIPETETKSLLGVIKELRKCSNSDARRLVEGKGVKIDGIVTENINTILLTGQLVQVGKRDFVRVK